MHIDFAGSLNGLYLIVVDNFSKWPEISRCSHRSSNWVSSRTILEVRGPDSTALDNGTQFISKEFKGFCKIFVVEHIIGP